MVFDVSFDNPTDGKRLSSPPIKRRLEAEAQKLRDLIKDKETRLKIIQQKQEIDRLRNELGVVARDFNARVAKVKQSAERRQMVRLT